MCGRYAQGQGIDDIVEQFQLDDSLIDHSLPINWNIAPTNEIYIVRNLAVENKSLEKRVLDTCSWGMIGPWIKDVGQARASQSHAINARSESIHEKPTFRSAFRNSRCLIPATGYYEWATALGKYRPKQPFYIHSADNKSLSMAGIWNIWKSESGEEIHTASIITREAVGKLAAIHSRMPVMMPIDRWEEWLDIDNRDVDSLIGLLDIPEPDRNLVAYPVSTRVNLVAHNGPELIKEIELGEPETLF